MGRLEVHIVDASVHFVFILEDSLLGRGGSSKRQSLLSLHLDLPDGEQVSMPRHDILDQRVDAFNPFLVLWLFAPAKDLRRVAGSAEGQAYESEQLLAHCILDNRSRSQHADGRRERAVSSSNDHKSVALL